MLKIKKDINLKELKEFKFNYKIDEYHNYWYKDIVDGSQLVIFEDTRQIIQSKVVNPKYGFTKVNLDEKYVQDLIEADLVNRLDDYVVTIHSYKEGISEDEFNDECSVTVGELIENLKKYPPETKVFIDVESSYGYISTDNYTSQTYCR